MTLPANSELAFASKCDAWLYVVLVASVLVMAASLVTVVVVEASPAEQLVAGLIGAASMGLVVWVLLGTRYVLAQDGLRIRSGPFRWRIPYDAITAVSPSQSPLSGPALSLDRLAIRYGPGRTVLVSPKDREAFLAALRARAKHLAEQ